MRGKYAQPKQGAVMLFALLILTVMAAIGFVVSSLVYREVNVSRSFDDSLRSYYAAETGIEHGLDIVALYRQNHETLASTLLAIESYPLSTFVLDGSDATYSMDSTQTSNTTEELTTPIRDFYQIDLYDPDNSISTLMTAESMRIEWDIPASCSSGSRMELTFDEYSSGSFGLDDDSVYKQVYTCGVETSTGGYDCQATTNWPSTNTNYIVQVRSLDCSTVDAHIQFFDADNASGSAVSIPSVVNIASIGTGDLSQREIVAHTKWVPNASGLGSFVLFSLESISH